MSERNFRSDIAPLVGERFATPSGSANFMLEALDSERLAVSTTSGSKVYLRLSAFDDVLRYLIDNGHDQNNPCQIRSSNDVKQAGPLCVIARGGGGPRTVTYMLPILQRLGYIGIDFVARPITAYALA